MKTEEIKTDAEPIFTKSQMIQFGNMIKNKALGYAQQDIHKRYIESDIKYIQTDRMLDDFIESRK